MIARILTVLAIVAMGSPAIAGEHSYVRDGDTIVVGGTPVRLKGLSCAELGTALGQRQKAFLKAWFARSSKVDCTLTGQRTYDREVGWCSLDGVDIGGEMIAAASCQPCRRYDTTGKYAAFAVTGPVPGYCG